MFKKKFFDEKKNLKKKKIFFGENFWRKFRSKISAENFGRKFRRKISVENFGGKFRSKMLTVIFHRKLPRRITVNFCGANFRNFRQKFFFHQKFFFSQWNFKVFPPLRFLTKIPIWAKKNHFWPKTVDFGQHFRFFSIFEFFFSENIFFDYRNEIYAIDYPRKFEKMVKIVHRKKKLRLAENVLAASI